MNVYEDKTLRPPLSRSSLSVTGRIFVISGGTQGLGLEIARHLRLHGASGVALVSRSKTKGKLVCETRPIYGGTGHPGISRTRFDEPGYIAIPDCMWGSSDYGLEAPMDLDGIPLHVVKTANATEEHYGEMAGGQPWVLKNTPHFEFLV